MYLSYQRVEIISKQSAFVDDISFEDDKEKEETQHHVTKVTEYVVERTVKHSWKSVTRILSTQGRHLLAILLNRNMLTHLRAPSGWAHRKL